VFGLVQSLEHNGFEVQIFDCSTDTGVPTFKCLIYDDSDKLFPPGGGYGSSLDPAIAMQRAILEAAQGRAVVIAGARDDVFSYDIEQASNSQQRVPTLIEENGNSLMSSRAKDCFGEDIALLCENLKGIGIERIAVVALPVDFLGISVVKVIIPKLEGYKSNNYIASQRAVDFSRGQAAGNVQKFDYLHFPAGGAA
jgi:ribosomal protein S12 methylthiotransferase accessory factor